MGSTFNIDRYKEMLAKHLPRRIESNEDYDHWVAVLETMRKCPNPTPEQKTLADLVNIMVSEYRRTKDLELLGSDPLATLKALMQANKVRPVDLSRLLGVSRSAASQILHGKRGISKDTALKLADKFGVPVGVFLSAERKQPSIRRSSLTTENVPSVSAFSSPSPLHQLLLHRRRKE